MKPMRKTKIVCTLGPAVAGEQKLYDLIMAGCDVARFNFSHADGEAHTDMFRAFDRARKKAGKPAAALLDTRGPEVRTALGGIDAVHIADGSFVTLTPRRVKGSESQIGIDYENLSDDVSVGQQILIDDGLIAMTVEEIRQKDLICSVKAGGTVSDCKSVNVPGAELAMEYLSDRDKRDILLGIELGFDYIAASFVTNAQNIGELRGYLDSNGGADIGIIAKIESARGVGNADEILAAADGVMIARGDLGVEIPFEDVPVVQKSLIKKALGAGKISITATQMLESMIENPRPTRAEAADVANAIYDGTSAVMLSGETAAGRYPIEAAKAMDRISRRTEADINYRRRLKNIDSPGGNMTYAIAHATCSIAHDLDAKAIISVTQSGYTARMVSSFRPDVPIIGCTPLESTLRRLSLAWGVIPLKAEMHQSGDDMLADAVFAALERRLVCEADTVVLTAGIPIGIPGTTNLIKVDIVKR
jgi:pyruvate kinase